MSKNQKDLKYEKYFTLACHYYYLLIILHYCYMKCSFLLLFGQCLVKFSMFFLLLIFKSFNNFNEYEIGVAIDFNIRQ